MGAYSERQAILKVYPHKKDWVDKMSDQQAVAIFVRLKSQGKLRK
jgi:hypothetical protein